MDGSARGLLGFWTTALAPSHNGQSGSPRTCQNVASDLIPPEFRVGGVLRIRPSLTPLAATGLVMLLIGATVLTPIVISPAPASAAPSMSTWSARQPPIACA